MAARPIEVERVLDVVAAAANCRAPDALPAIQRLANLSGLYDEFIAQPAMAALMAWGVDGLNALAVAAGKGFYSSDAQRYLLAIGGQLDLKEQLPSTVAADWLSRCRIEIDEPIRRGAVAAMRNLLLAQATDESLRRRLIFNLFQEVMFAQRKGAGSSTSELFLSMFVDARLVINELLLEQFSRLLDSAPDREEELHRFLVEHPILLDPLALEVRSKHELGDDFVTDFVVKRFNDEYVLVEIEKSTDRLFTSSGRLHSQLTDAVSQVRDFQSWIHDNIAYARTKLPGIRRPEGLVVIGRSMQLTDQDRIRLDEENFGRRGHIKIVTYDELLEQGRTIHRNLLSRL
jgi:hypothetical protein